MGLLKNKRDLDRRVLGFDRMESTTTINVIKQIITIRSNE